MNGQFKGNIVFLIICFLAFLITSYSPETSVPQKAKSFNTPHVTMVGPLRGKFPLWDSYVC